LKPPEIPYSFKFKAHLPPPSELTNQCSPSRKRRISTAATRAVEMFGEKWREDSTDLVCPWPGGMTMGLSSFNDAEGDGDNKAKV
jgi:hypothetical protein